MKSPRKGVWILSILAALFLAFWIGFYERPLSYFNHLLYLQMEVSGATSRWITVDGHRIHYYEIGRGDQPPVVLVHGLGGHAEDWRNLSPYFVASGHRVYIPDLPGYGRSERPRDFSYSIPDEADAVVHWMDALGLKRVDLAGHSMGGWIVQWIAARHPERVEKLVLIDSAGLHDRPTWNVDLFMPTSAQELDELDALLMTTPPQVPAFIARDVLRVSRENAWVIRRALDSMMTGEDTTDNLLPTLKMPVLIIWGAQDRITPLAEGEKMHQLLPQSKLDVVQGCGHLAPISCADKMGQTVRLFLTQK